MASMELKVLKLAQRLERDIQAGEGSDATVSAVKLRKVLARHPELRGKLEPYPLADTTLNLLEVQYAIAAEQHTLAPIKPLPPQAYHRQWNRQQLNSILTKLTTQALQEMAPNG